MADATIARTHNLVMYLPDGETEKIAEDRVIQILAEAGVVDVKLDDPEAPPGAIRRYVGVPFVVDLHPTGLVSS